MVKNTSSKKRTRFQIKNSLLTIEIILCIVSILLSLAMSHIPNFLFLSFHDYLTALSSLNTGLVFAMFLTLYTLSDSQNIKEAQKHKAYIQPAVFIIANSIFICLWSALFPPMRFIKIAITLVSTVQLAINVLILKKLLQLSFAQK